MKYKLFTPLSLKYYDFHAGSNIVKLKSWLCFEIRDVKEISNIIVLCFMF